MTIYKGKTADEKKSAKKLDKSPIVWTTDDVLPLTKAEFGQSEENFPSTGVSILRSKKQECHQRFMKICAVLAILTVFAFAVCLGYFVRQKIFNKPFVDTMHVRFAEYHRRTSDLDQPVNTIEGGFFEQVELEWRTKQYVKINVPPFIDVKSATVIHDFIHMWTAIVDHDDSYCFILPLNTSVIFTPEAFMKYIKGMHRFGKYSAMVFTVDRQSRKVVTPPLENLLKFGSQIARECHYYDTYTLVKADEPIAMSKRFACRFSGKTYSLGGAGFPVLALIDIDGCL